MRKNNLRKLFAYGCFGGIIIGMLGSMYGCTNNRHAVIAVTGTNIGVEISQNPANQSPQAKLGYQRSEVAIVPSNRSGGIEPAGTSTVGRGASDVANVLMELKYSNIFSINTSGIYQRLAVGKTAVSQQGAAYMFARDQKGNLDPETAAAIASIESIKYTLREARKLKVEIVNLNNKYSSTPDKQAMIKEVVKEITSKDWDSFCDAKDVPLANLEEILDKLKEKGIE